ncbi:DUF817 domain-containing protein [Streptomyces pluripotens]|uniref:DUF817 domain-containing protein n=1 Tax=Streptomyces pluripotens TaxID=1355015 RepID=A0A221P4V4_9ACTN|nr:MULTISPECIES: DUF817 domain-containing protein [Streptomyces]ARP72996.1 hypothetical protein LK06_026885 [Streptomyces pluripotens]ASN27247.1 DUF817 domain-containing protein [Streptomyces pluripotens]MCH0557907.1 DUF817 domain-containing protein [Streptomyces sp. MUM 16J]
MRRTMKGLGHATLQWVRFGVVQARCCAFAVALLAGVAVSGLLPRLPVARYDLVLVYGVLLTLLARKVGWESRHDTVVIAVCHVVGLLFELVKVHLGSWSYPEHALTKIAGVPLYGGFMYAAVASYVCRARRLLRLRYTRYRATITTLVATAIYVNFLTHHWIPDMRWPLAVAMIAATFGSRVGFTVGGHRYGMPLAVSFALIGFFLWVAENAATYAGAWSYPQQLDGWQPVPLTKFGAWSLLISVTFVLVEHLTPVRPGTCPGRPVPPPRQEVVSDSFKTD